jgi:flavin-binding protein dodecin
MRTEAALFRRRYGMSSVARITEISSESNQSFEDAIRTGIERANKTLRNVKGAWIKEQQITVDGGNISAFRVNMLVTFVLED